VCAREGQAARGVDPEEKRREEKRREEKRRGEERRGEDGADFRGFRPVGTEAALLGEGDPQRRMRMLLLTSPTMLATRTTMTTSRGLD